MHQGLRMSKKSSTFAAAKVKEAIYKEKRGDLWYRF